MQPEQVNKLFSTLVAVALVGLFLLFARQSFYTGEQRRFQRRSIEELSELLLANDPGDRQAAVIELKRRGTAAKSAIPALSKALHDPDEYVPMIAARALRVLTPESEAALPDLLAALEHLEYAAARAAAFTVVSMLGERAIPILTERFSNSSNRAKAVIAQALSTFGAAAVEAEPLLLLELNSPDKRLQRMATAALGSMRSEEAVNGIMALLQDSEMLVRYDAAEALGAIGPDAAEAVPVLLELFENDWYMRDSAGEALGGIGPGAVATVPVMIRYLEAKEENSRYLAAYVLRRIATPEAREAWLKYAANATPAFINRLRDPAASASRRGFAAKALGYIADDTGYDPLIEALRDDEKEVREQAARALGFFGSEQAVAPLIEVLGTDRSIAGNVCTALRRIGTAEALAAVREDDKFHGM